LVIALNGLVTPILALTLAPLLMGVINRVKALVAGRTGPPLLQVYYDLWRLLHKGAVYSETTTWLFRAGPIVSLSTLIVACMLMPMSDSPALFSFSGDMVVFVSLLALGRFAIVLAALDTGSAFEGMGAAREVFFASLAEPAMLLGMAAIAKATVANQTMLLSLSSMNTRVSLELWSNQGVILVFVAAALMVVFLAENSRIPVDDPTTHLELTMIHEVIVLDHSGPDLAFVLYAACLKLWLLALLIVELVIPDTGNLLLDLAADVGTLFVLAAVVGLVESAMARLRMPKVPQLLVGATTLTVLALVLELRN
jgi:formate hydrogenlyase subunit 4